MILNRMAIFFNSTLIKKVTSVEIQALIISLLAIYANFLFSLNFPIPWDDESYFVLQSLSFAKSNTLATPELTPNRIIMWMQPGYMLVLGLYFKFINFSLQNARIASLFFYCWAIYFQCKAVNRDGNLFNFIITAIAFLIPASLAVSNIARMDSLVLAIVMGALIATQKQRFLLSISLVLLGGLIHFNSIYFFIPVILIMATYHRDLIENIKKSNMFDIYMFMTAIIFFLAYSIFIYMNLNDFILDMTYQFSRKLGRAPFFYNIKFMLLLFFSLFVMIFTYNPKQKHVFVASSFAATMILVYVNGQEMWYQVFRNIGLSILIILLIGSFNKGLLRVFIGGSLVFLLVGGTSGIAFSGMRPNLLRGDYIDESFSRSLENSLLKLRKNEGRNLSVSFNITGADMMFYNFLSEHHFQLVHRMPAELVQPMPVDVCIHISRNLDPNWLHTLTINQLPDPSLCRLATILSGSNDEVAVMLNHNYSSYWHRLYGHHKN